MSEKEFLIKFVTWMEGNGLLDSDVDPTYESFLEDHHKKYYEVEFIKKDSPSGDAINLMNTMQEFKTKLED